MKSKLVVLMIAGFLPILACNNPIIEQFWKTNRETPTPGILSTVTYTVAFESDGGSPVKSQTVVQGEKANRPENPTKNGFGFVNWYDNGECAGDSYDFESPVTDDIDLYAQWSEIFYTVTFDSNGGSDVDDQQVGENGTASRLVPTKDGYTFDDWYRDPELTAEYDFDAPVTVGITLYAKWSPKTYTVIFMDGDKELSELTRTVTHGTAVNRPTTNPTKDGYSFDDWYRDPDLTVFYDFETPVTDDIDLYAKWSPKTYTVTFMDGGEVLSELTRTVTHGNTVNRPSDPTKDGYSFDDWYRDPGLTAVYDFATPVTANIPLYAEWKPTHLTSAKDHEMVWIPAGTFRMGSPATEPGRDSNTGVETLHPVTLTAGFYMGKYLVTQAQYEAVIGNNPSYYQGDPGTSRGPVAGETPEKLPVERVSWYDVIVFCNRLSMQEGLSPAYRINGSTDPAAWGSVPGINNAVWNAVQIVAGSTGYRLPTEAQWEYACRAGTTTAYYTGATVSDNTGWYRDNSNTKPHEVGLKTPNTWDLYDMHGNVWEWCGDWYETYASGEQTDPQGAVSGDRRVARGGTKANYEEFMRSASRQNCPPHESYADQGFRITRPGAPGLSQAITYTVTFNSSGGSPVAGQTVTEGDTATRPDNPLYEDYTLFNWYTDNALGTPFNFNTPIRENTTVYAGWTDSDFPGMVIHKIFNGASITELNTIVNTISGGGENKNYVVNVTSGFDVAGRTTNNFGSASGIRVSLRGAGRTLGLSSPGNLLRIGSGQTVILRGLTLAGRYPNNNSVVYVSGTNSSFIMQSGKISGNSISGNSTSDYGGGGVCVDSGIFTMNDGEISNNDITASRGSDSGGGVYVKNGTFTMDGGKISGNKAGVGGGVNVCNTNSTFTMNGGEISGNNALDGAGVYVDRDATFMMYNGKISGNTTTYEGGGVYVYYYSGTFIMYGGEITGNKAGDGGGVYVGYFNASNFGTLRIVTGTIYGSNEANMSLRNTSSRGAALYKDRTCIAQYGTFNGTTWFSSDNLSTTNNTIKITNGVLQQ